MNLFENKENKQQEAVLPDENEAPAVPAQIAEPGELVLDIEGLQETKQETAEAAENVLKAETKILPRVEQIETNLHAKLEEAVSAQNASEPEKESPNAKPEAVRKPANAISYASMAEAVVNAKKESTGRFSRDAVDDDTLLQELYALIGDGSQPKNAKRGEEHTTPRPVQPVRPAARLTPEDLQAAPEIYEDVLEEDAGGVPGWLKGSFILLISLLLSAMTFYAVASDLLGKIF